MHKGAWAEKAWQNECQGWLEMGRQPYGVFRVERVGPWVCAWRQEPGSEHQWMLLEPAEPQTALEHLREGRAALRLPVLEHPAPWREALKGRGFRPLGSDVLMACPLGETAPPQIPEGMRAGLVQSVLERQEALEVVRFVFGDPPGTTEFFSPPSLVRQYALRVHGLTVAAAAVWPFAGVAGIFSVATLPKWRKQGLATLLLRHLLHEARAEGFPLAVLRTYDELVPMYGRLGFQSVGRSERWSQP